MKFRLKSACALATLTLSTLTQAATCHHVRFADVGWTDISATTALASVLLESLGYSTKTRQVSVPVTYVSLKNKDLDVFLGNWMPTMSADIMPYTLDGSVETVGTLLQEARYTLAVPNYVADAGITSVNQLASHAAQFQNRIYGIEPGNDGNRLIQRIIQDKSLGLDKWKLVESSEQAMLMEVIRATKAKKWVVFLGWEPHPMNQKIKLTYLKGADQYFGPNQGTSTVYVNTRKSYAQECPEVTHLLKNLNLSVEIENTLMSMILDEKLEPKLAAKKWLQSHLPVAEKWLKGTKSLDGKNGVERLKSYLSAG